MKFSFTLGAHNVSNLKKSLKSDTDLNSLCLDLIWLFVIWFSSEPHAGQIIVIDVLPYK